MEPEKLRALLTTLRDFGVARYEADGVKVEFGDKVAAKTEAKAAQRRREPRPEVPGIDPDDIASVTEMIDG